jgi:diguanylate cyclase (GGDEF)-like protein
VRDHRTKLGEGPAGTCALYRRPVNVPDVREDTRYVAVVPECVAELCVPMVSRDELLGVVAVANPAPAAFTDRDERLLTAFAQLTALALVHARAHQSRRTDVETIRAQLGELQALFEVGQRAASLDLDGTLHAVAGAIQRLTTADSTAIYLWPVEGEALELVALTYDRRLYPDDYEQRLRRLPVGRGQDLVGWVAEHQQPLLIGDISKDTRPLPVPGLPLEARAAIVVPIIAENRLLGVIRAAKLGANSFTQDHFRLALTLASQSALALAATNAHREQARHIEELGALYETSVSLSEASTLDEVLDVVLRKAVQITQADAGLIWRSTAEGAPRLAESHNLDAAAVAAVMTQSSSGLDEAMAGSGRPVLVDDVHSDGRLSWAHAVPHLRSLAGVPLRSERVAYGSLFVLHARRGFFRPENVRRLEVLAAQAASALARARAFEEARRLAITDELTGCYNTRYFTERLAEEVERAKRYGHALSLIIIDSDSLKIVNDRFGHGEGNRHLVEVANTIRQHVRSTDIVARFGGDEFIILQPETELAAALVTADRIRAAAGRPFTSANGETVEVSVSGGVAAFPASADSANELFRQADHALYVSKRRGKNVVASAPTRGEISDESAEASGA